MDLCDPMIASSWSHRCRVTVADRCIVAKRLKSRRGQGFSLQRCPVHVIVATHRCSHFIVADRCTVATAPNALIHKGTSCNGDRCSPSLIATPLFIRGGVATMNVQRRASVIMESVCDPSRTPSPGVADLDPMGLAATSAGVQQGVA